MKDKEKQIEEMALQFAKKYCKVCGCENCDWAYEFGTKEESCEDYLHYKQMAEYFYNLGYQKLPKDSVVLSREEYNELKQEWTRRMSTNKRNHYLERRVSKETAKKYHNLLKEKIENSFIAKFQETWLVFNEFNDEIAKQFGVEIKEN